MSQKYRLLTRSDFDGLVCAILLKEMGVLGDIKFVHPKDVQDGKVEVLPTDILTNLPYSPNCHLCFDHHASEELRADGPPRANHVLETDAASAARVVYNYYGGVERFPDIQSDMLLAVDKADSAQFTRADVLDPRGWELLSFLMDARTGLGRFREFRVSNYQLMMALIDHCRDHAIEQILELPDVQERVRLFEDHRPLFEDQLRRCSTVHEAGPAAAGRGQTVVLDLRGEETIYAGNRFMIYALFPRSELSIHVLWGLKKQNTVLAIGKSIFNRGNTTHVGELCLRYGGGGHAAAGTCQVPHEDSQRVLEEILEQARTDAVLAEASLTSAAARGGFATQGGDATPAFSAARV